MSAQPQTPGNGTSAPTSTSSQRLSMVLPAAAVLMASPANPHTDATERARWAVENLDALIRELKTRMNERRPS